MMRSRRLPPTLTGLLLAAVLAGCDDSTAPVAIEELPTTEAPTSGFPVGELESVTAPGLPTLNFWPYTQRTPVPTMDQAADPINLILVGDADPRDIRRRLMALPGARGPGLPDCTWTDAIGGTQAAFADGFGWEGSAVQLQCGDYGHEADGDPTRFHMRLFRFGDYTIANAHLDLLIPGTTDHAVISWKLAEELAVFDILFRLGANVVGAPTDLNSSPQWRQIQPAVWALLGPLQAFLIGSGSTDADGNLLNDGAALILDVSSNGNGGKEGADIARQTVDIDFAQLIPRPFCTDGAPEALWVEGPVTLTQQVVYTPAGGFHSRYHAKGKLDVTLFNPLTDPPTPISEPYRAVVNQHGTARMNDISSMVTDIQLRMEVRPGGGERGTLKLNVRVGPNGAGFVSGSSTCK